MNCLVIYGSRYGNTQDVAEAIADGLRAYAEVTVTPVEKAPLAFAPAPDLVVIGGPTEAHGMSPALKAYLDLMADGALKGVAAAAFDTRMQWPRWISGSAGADITRRLEKLGANVVAPQASFMVEGKNPVLRPGEPDRAVAWGDTLGRVARAEVAAHKFVKA